MSKCLQTDSFNRTSSKTTGEHDSSFIYYIVVSAFWQLLWKNEFSMIYAVTFHREHSIFLVIVQRTGFFTVANTEFCKRLHKEVCSKSSWVPLNRLCMKLALKQKSMIDPLNTIFSEVSAVKRSCILLVWRDYQVDWWVASGAEWREAQKLSSLLMQRNTKGALRISWNAWSIATTQSTDTLTSQGKVIATKTEFICKDKIQSQWCRHYAERLLPTSFSSEDWFWKYLRQSMKNRERLFIAILLSKNIFAALI